MFAEQALMFRYELLFGKRPFRGRTNTALTNAILHEHLTWPEDVADKCSTSGMQAIRAVSRHSSRTEAYFSLSSAIQARGLGIVQEELGLRISKRILGSQGSTGMRYTGKKLYRLSSLM